MGSQCAECRQRTSEPESCKCEHFFAFATLLLSIHSYNPNIQIQLPLLNSQGPFYPKAADERTEFYSLLSGIVPASFMLLMNGLGCFDRVVHSCRVRTVWSCNRILPHRIREIRRCTVSTARCSIPPTVPHAFISS